MINGVLPWTKESVEKAVKRGSRTGSRSKRYTYDEKLRAVKLFDS